MKFGICCTFIVLVALINANASRHHHHQRYVGYNNENHHLLLHKAVFKVLKTYIHDNCQLHYINNNNYAALKQHYEQFLTYGQYAFALLPQDKRRFCAVEQYRLLELLMMTLNNAKKCLHPFEKYLADFAFTSVDQGLGFLCEDKGKVINRLFSNESLICWQRTPTNRIDNFFAVFQSPTEIINKEDLCSHLRGTYASLQSIFDVQCSTYVESVYNQLVDRMFCSCNNDCPSLDAGRYALAAGASFIGGGALPLLAAIMVALNLREWP